MADQKVWTKEEIVEMWVQSRRKLREFQRHLERNSGITAAQLGMALQLADVEFNRILSEVKRTPEQWCNDLRCRILDPDGWRTSTAPPMDQPITLEEFQERFNHSTVFGGHDI